MKILYVYTSAGIKAGSVQNKVVQQIKALNAIGVQCEGIFFSTDDFEQNTSALFRFVSVPKVTAKYFRSSKQRAAYHQTVFDYFETREHDYDFVYYRYSGAHRILNRMLKNVPGKVFFEHVTSEINEIRMYRTENPFRWNLSSILSLLEFYYAPVFREKYFGSKIRKNALFGLCNSTDIAKQERDIAGGHYETLILGDSVSASDFSIKKACLPNDEFNMIFLKGAGTVADFNGLDRVFKGILNYKGPKKICFYLFGKNLDAEIKMVSSLGIQNKVKLGGFISKEETDFLMDSMHLGIGALAVHRKGLKSTTTIKTREYFARGLPFIYGHNDPDFFNNPEAKKYSLQIDSNDEPIDFDQVIHWSESVGQDIQHPRSMHDFAVRNLDYSVKMAALKSFLEQRYKF